MRLKALADSMAVLDLQFPEFLLSPFGERREKFLTFSLDLSPFFSPFCLRFVTFLQKPSPAEGSGRKNDGEWPRDIKNNADGY